MSSATHRGIEGDAEVHRLRTLYQLLSSLSQAKALEDVYGAALTSLLDATAADRAAILLFDEDGVMRFKASRGISKEYQAAVTGHSPWPKGAPDARPLVAPDALLDDGLADYHHALRREGIRGVTFVPLVLDGGVIGKFMLYYGELHECAAGEIEIAQAIAAHVALATRHKQLEAVSRRLAAIVESSEDAIVGKDARGIIESWNKGAERIFGYTADEVIGRPVSILAGPDRLDEMPGILSRVLEGKRVEHYETRRRRKDGRIIDVALSVSPVRNAAGHIIGASKIARDITDRKLAERERAALLSAEHEARRIAELLNSVGPKLAAQLELEKLVQAITDVATELVGAEFGSFFQNFADQKGESQAPYAVSGMPREKFEELPMPWNTDVTGPVFRGEGVLRCEDITGDPRYGANQPCNEATEGPLPVRSYLAAPIVSRSGEVLGGLFFGHSAPGRFVPAHEAIITGIAAHAAIAMDNARLFEQAQWAQAELKRSNEDLRRANRDLEVFAYSASHDLQEPLRTIAISAQLIERTWGQQLEGDDATFLGHILSGVKRMSELLADLLAYVKATKHEEGQATGVDPGRILADVLESLGALVQQTGAVVTAEELPGVAIHEGRLGQIFQNLITNAIKYRGKEDPRVNIGAVLRDGWCVFSVTDNGMGIEAQYAERIFGLFKRLHNREKYPGSGIGLAICQRIVEQYGGRIWLEQSEPGLGSTFCFSVPLCP